MQKLLSFELNPDVVCSELSEGGVLLDLASKQYFALNASGILAWKALEAGGSLAPLGERLAAIDPGRGGDDPFGLSRFGAALVAHGLASLSDTGSPGVAFAQPLPVSWQSPEVTPHGRPLAQVVPSPFDPTEPIPE
jgi:hypothetical protein